MVYCLSCGSAHSQEHYEEEIERLRAALVEERAARIYCERAHDFDYPPPLERGEPQPHRSEARAELIAEGLLPPA